MAQAKTLEVKPVKVDLWSSYPLLKRACSCESWGDPNKEPRQFKDGKVLRGYPNPHDIGSCQLNEPIWGKKAKELGFDIYTLKGNVDMAKWIYSNTKQGIESWHWSRGCWKIR